MANVDKPMGFRLFKMAGKTIRATRYPKTASANVYEGDLVKRVAAGTVEVCGAGITAGIVGVASAASLSTDEDFVWVYDDPEAVFIGQGDSATAFAAADKGLNVDILAGSPDTALRRSGQELDISTAAATANLPFKMLDLAPALNGDDNDAGAAHANILVKLNNCERAGGTGSTGI